MPAHDAGVVLYGATGYTGRLIAEALDRDGVPFVVAGRDQAKLDALAANLDTAPEAVAVGLDERARLSELFARAPVVVSAAGPYTHLGPPAVRAALSAGSHFVDIAGEQSYLRWCADQDAAAKKARVAVVNAMGFDVVPSDLACVLACRGLDQVARLDVCIATKGSHGRGITRGTRRSMAEMAGEGAWYDHGAYRLGPPGRFRRRFELPAPLGEREAVFVPWGDVVTAPRSTGADQVRTFFSVPAKQVRTMHLSWPLTAVAERLPFVQARLRKKARGADDGPSEEERRAARFTIQAEATTPEGEVQTAVVSGRDMYGLTGNAAALAAQLIVEGEVSERGVLTPSQAFDLEQFCKRLEGFGLAWSVVEP